VKKVEHNIADTSHPPLKKMKLEVQTLEDDESTNAEASDDIIGRIK
jgi:hypothetical protein